jgi:sulfur carrier protein ThiS
MVETGEIVVTYGRLGGRLADYSLYPGSTVQDLLAAAGAAWGTEEIRVNNTIISDPQHPLTNGDRVTVMAQPRGGQITCEVGQVGGEVIKVAVGDRATVQDVLNAGDIDGNGDIRLNSRMAHLDDPVREGDIILVTPHIIGG